MPRKIRRDSLTAEAAGLQALIADATAVGDFVGQLQYQQRIDEIQHELHELEALPSPLASVALYFSGAPVFGSRGIAADFAGKILGDFQELVSKNFAKAELGSIGKRGKIPLQQNTELLVTSLAHGSFGFVLDEINDQDQLCDTALKDVVAETVKLIASVSSEEEATFEEVMSEIDSRVLISLRDFFKDMDNASASIRLIEDLNEYILDSHAVHRARLRTEFAEIAEETQLIRGFLKGFLPDHKKFELVDLTGSTIYGTATKEATVQFEKAIQSGIPAISSECAANFLIRLIKPLNVPEKFTYRLINFESIGSLPLTPDDS